MRVHLYPVTETGLHCTNYTVTVNGVPAALNTARVSAVPFNRRWPGHQRSEEQAEQVNFLSMAMDAPVTIGVTPSVPFEEVVIRPQSLGIRPRIENGTIFFTLEKPAYFTLEPYGRQAALHVFADPMPQYPAPDSIPDCIYFGPGEHDVGQIVLESNQTLFLDEGAVVYACIQAHDAENIRILGRGILDNSRNKEEILFPCNAENNDTAVTNARRQHTIQLEYCTHVEIDGITIRDSLVYNIRPVACRDLHISNVKIIGCWRYNSDGIDMHNCEDVLIENCFLRTFDDTICVKGFDCYQEGDVDKAVWAAMHHNGQVYDTFRNARIRGCVLWNDWGKALEIGAETRAEEICGILFEDCDILHVTGQALDCANIDYADVHHIVYQNIRVEYDDCIPAPLIQTRDTETYRNPNPDYAPNLISVYTAYHHEYSAGGQRRGHCRDMAFRNIHYYGKRPPKLYFAGYDEAHKTRNITVENLYHNGVLLTEIPAEDFQTGKFTENIAYTVNRQAFSDVNANTVDPTRQLKPGGCVRFFHPEGTGKRILFVGNSMTLHGVAPQIGWMGEWGMAASCPERDYVHILMNRIRSLDPEAAFCICQVSQWERNYKTGTELHSLYENARNFQADMIVMRFVENCPRATDYNGPLFRREMDALLRYLDKTGKAQIIMTTGFWRHPADGDILAYARERELPCISLGDLGEQDAMKALGLFAHTGVARHPGDLGMQHMADRIFEKLAALLPIDT